MGVGGGKADLCFICLFGKATLPSHRTSPVSTTACCWSKIRENNISFSIFSDCLPSAMSFWSWRRCPLFIDRVRAHISGQLRSEYYGSWVQANLSEFRPNSVPWLVSIDLLSAPAMAMNTGNTIECAYHGLSLSTGNVSTTATFTSEYERSWLKRHVDINKTE